VPAWSAYRRGAPFAVGVATLLVAFVMDPALDQELEAGVVPDLLCGLQDGSLCVDDVVTFLQQEIDLSRPAPRRGGLLEQVPRADRECDLLDAEPPGSQVLLVEDHVVRGCFGCHTLQMKVHAVAQALAGLGTRMFTWAAENIGAFRGEREYRDFCDAMIRYMQPCAGVDVRIAETVKALEFALLTATPIFPFARKLDTKVVQHERSAFSESSLTGPVPECIGGREPLQPRETDAWACNKHWPLRHEFGPGCEVPDVTVCFQASRRARELCGLYHLVRGVRVNGRFVYRRGHTNIVFTDDGHWAFKGGTSGCAQVDIYAFAADDAQAPYDVQTWQVQEDDGDGFIADRKASVTPHRVAENEEEDMAQDKKEEVPLPTLCAKVPFQTRDNLLDIGPIGSEETKEVLDAGGGLSSAPPTFWTFQGRGGSEEQEGHPAKSPRASRAGSKRRVDEALQKVSAAEQAAAVQPGFRSCERDRTPSGGLDEAEEGPGDTSRGSMAPVPRRSTARGGGEEQEVLSKSAQISWAESNRKLDVALRKVTAAEQTEAKGQDDIRDDIGARSSVPLGFWSSERHRDSWARFEADEGARSVGRRSIPPAFWKSAKEAGEPAPIAMDDGQEAAHPSSASESSPLSQPEALELAPTARDLTKIKTDVDREAPQLNSTSGNSLKLHRNVAELAPQAGEDPHGVGHRSIPLNFWTSGARQRDRAGEDDGDIGSRSIPSGFRCARTWRGDQAAIKTDDAQNAPQLSSGCNVSPKPQPSQAVENLDEVASRSAPLAFQKACTSRARRTDGAGEYSGDIGARSIPSGFWRARTQCGSPSTIKTDGGQKSAQVSSGSDIAPMSRRRISSKVWLDSALDQPPTI